MDYESHETKIRFLLFIRDRDKEKKPVVHIDLSKELEVYHDRKEILN